MLQPRPNPNDREQVLSFVQRRPASPWYKEKTDREVPVQDLKETVKITFTDTATKAAGPDMITLEKPPSGPDGSFNRQDQ